MSDSSNQPAKLAAKLFVQGIIEVQTGIHIGGNSIGMAIGGADSVVVRNPLNNEPYIPGSSLRGKMRSLLERVRGVEDDVEGGFHWESGHASAGKNSKSKLGKFFGTSAETSGTPTRLTVRDCPLTTDVTHPYSNSVSFEP